MTLQDFLDARDTLNKAIFSGQKMVRFADGREVEYQNTDQMLQAKADLDAEINSILQGNVPGTSANFSSRVSFGVRA